MIINKDSQTKITLVHSLYHKTKDVFVYKAYPGERPKLIVNWLLCGDYILDLIKNELSFEVKRKSIKSQRENLNLRYWKAQDLDKVIIIWIELKGLIIGLDEVKRRYF